MTENYSLLMIYYFRFLKLLANSLIKLDSSGQRYKTVPLVSIAFVSLLFLSDYCSNLPSS